MRTKQILLPIFLVIMFQFYFLGLVQKSSLFVQQKIGSKELYEVFAVKENCVKRSELAFKEENKKVNKKAKPSFRGKHIKLKKTFRF